MYLSLIISLFPVFLIPLFSLFMCSVFFNLDSNTLRFKKFFFIGMLNYAAARLFLLIVENYYKINYEKIPLFFHLWFSEIVVFLVFILFTYLVMVRKGILRQDSYREFPYIFSYVAGFLTLFGLMEVVSSQLKLDIYIVFFYPLIGIILLLLASIILIEAGTRRGYKSILFYILMLPLSLVLAAIPWLYYINYLTESFWLLTAVLVGACLVFFLLRKDYIRN